MSMTAKDFASTCSRRLQRVAPVHEQRRHFLQHHGDAGRAGEAGEPGEPLGRFRHIFVLVLVRARNDQAIDAAPRQFGAQPREPQGAVLGGGVVGEALESALEHVCSLCLPRRGGNIAPASEAFTTRLATPVQARPQH